MSLGFERKQASKRTHASAVADTPRGTALIILIDTEEEEVSAREMRQENKEEKKD